MSALPVEQERLVDGADLRATLRRHPAGVTVVTAPGPVGFTATSFTPVSLDPPLVSFCLGLRASALPAVERAPAFAVHVLGAGQASLATAFARSGVDRFAGVPWYEGPDGVPLLDGVPATLRARPVRRLALGDHLMVVGEVVAVAATGAGAALVHHDGALLGVGTGAAG